MKEKNMKRYQIAAGVGTLVMAVGSFMACLSTETVVANVGNVLLIVSIAISTYGFSSWQP